MFVLTVFTVWRLVSLLTINLSSQFIPRLDFFPYKNLLLNYKLPFNLTALAKFDGLHYLIIAHSGYHQFEQAFFPLYPLTIRLFGHLTHHYLLSGLFVSNFAFLGGLFIFYQYLKKLKIKPSWPLIFLVSFSTAFYFGALYTEGLFFFLLILSIYLFHEKKYFGSGLAAFFATTTRLTGIFLIFFPILGLIKQIIKEQSKNKLKKISPFLPGILFPLLALATYSAYLLKTTNDPLFFIHSQSAFGAHRSTTLIFPPQTYYRYLQIFITANHNWQYLIAWLEFITFNLVLFVLLIDLVKIVRRKSPLDRLSLNLFSLANLTLPALTGTLSSIPRYALFSISFFIFLGELKSPLIKLFISLIFIIGQVILLAFFSQGYFVS